MTDADLPYRENGIVKVKLGFVAAFTEMLRLARRHEYATLATSGLDHRPEAAPLRYALTDRFEIVMGTLSSSRKFANLQQNPEVAVLVWGSEFSLQIEGVVDLPGGSELKRLTAHFANEFPREAAIRSGRPSHRYFRITPRWARYSDFSDEPGRVLTLDFIAESETRGTWPVLP